MEINRELLNGLFRNVMDVKSITVTYPDETISGFYRHVDFKNVNRPDVTICKHSVPKGSYPYHYLDYDSATRIEVEYNDGSSQTFS